MMKNNFSNKLYFWWLSFIYLFFANFLVATPAFAVPNVMDMIVNIAATIPDLMMLTTAMAYVLGFYFVFHGLSLLKKYAEQRTQMSGEAKMSGPLLFLFVGAALIYLPSAVSSGMATFFTMNYNPYGYETGSNTATAIFISACFSIIQLIGVISFIRGLVLLAHAGQGGHQGTMGKAVAHIVGGVLCIDLYDFLNAVFTTLGLGPLPTW